MNCPICSSPDTRVLRTTAPDRRRACGRCSHRWTTVEVDKQHFESATKAVSEVRALAESLSVNELFARVWEGPKA